MKRKWLFFSVAVIASILTGWQFLLGITCYHAVMYSFGEMEILQSFIRMQVHLGWAAYAGAIAFIAACAYVMESKMIGPNEALISLMVLSVTMVLTFTLGFDRLTHLLKALEQSGDIRQAIVISFRVLEMLVSMVLVGLVTLFLVFKGVMVVNVVSSGVSGGTTT